MLSNKFHSSLTEIHTHNLYRSISRVMLALSRVPQPRIGSWTIDNNGGISLSNRPMFCHLHQLENWGILSGIPRDMTYTTSDGLYHDLHIGHDNRFQYQGNAVFDLNDAYAQAKDLVLMKVLFHQFTCQEYRNGPFVMQLTDLHKSNIFIDKDYNIKYIIDLEWTCSLPLTDLLPPFWLTGKNIDQIEDDEYYVFEEAFAKFVKIYEQEKAEQSLYYDKSTITMKNALEDGRYWYVNALQTPKGLFNIFRTHLESLYGRVPEESLGAVSAFWRIGMGSFVGLKLKELAQYRQEVHDIFNSEKSGKYHY